MKKKNILFITVFLILSVFIIYFFYMVPQNMQNFILDSLKDELEFCQPIKNEIYSFENRGNFWLLCNERPFYATYENDQINIESGGWSFLEHDAILWSDLENCDFYDSRNSNLIFYCPKNFMSSPIIAKIYTFNNQFEIEKLEEKEFLEIISNDIKKVYHFLSSCDIKEFKTHEQGDYPYLLSIFFDCLDGEYVVYTDLSTIPIQPPISLNSDLSNEERAKISFEKSFDLNAETIETFEDQIRVISGNFEVTYMLSGDMPNLIRSVNEIYDEEDIINVIEGLGKYFIFPPIDKIDKIEPLGEIYENIVAFRINDNYIVSVGHSKTTNSINAFWKKTEGIYR